MGKPIDWLPLPDRASARALERAVDAAFGFPNREGIVIGAGPATKRMFKQRRALTSRFAEAVEHEGGWRYPVFQENAHLLALARLRSDAVEERRKIVIRSNVDDEHHLKASYLLGVLQRVLSDFDDTLRDAVSLTGINIDREGFAVVWRNGGHSDRLPLADLFTNEESESRTSAATSSDQAVELLRACDRVEFDDHLWLAIPMVIEGPQSFRLYLVGLPIDFSGSLASIQARDDVSFLFNNILEAAVYLSTANIIRNIDRAFLTTDDVLGLAPPLRVVHVFLNALLAICDCEPPNEALVEVLQALSKSGYERRSLQTKLLLGGAQDVKLSLELQSPIDFWDRRLLRKTLEASDSNCIFVANTDAISGFGEVVAGQEARCLEIEFGPRTTWSIRQVGASTALFVVRDQQVKAIASHDTRGVERALNSAFGEEKWNTVLVRHALEASQQQHGAMLIVSEEAVLEANRLQSATALRFRPRELSRSDTVLALSRIDGALLFDPQGVCHSAGVIVDGTAIEVAEEDRHTLQARGARYNSAARYRELCAREGRSTVIVVVSEDGYFDVLSTTANRNRQNV